MKSRWAYGHRVRLLENGEQYFPAVFDAIRAARSEVIIETFILFEDKVGNELHDVLVAAAQRGVVVDLLVDGFGSATLTPPFIESLTQAGARLRTFDPGWRLFGKRLNIWRRMHRKVVVLDNSLAFVGGINFSADHLADFGPMAKQDYAVAIEGDIVHEIRRFTAMAISERIADRRNPPPEARQSARASLPMADAPRALFVTRDNRRHRNDIERHYRRAIRRARHRVLIANAYFFPGYRLLRQMSRAAKRGVDVRLILQGTPDMPIVRTAAMMLYGQLQRDGVKVHEYCSRPLHGKVAVIDDDWSTVGSSNLDPLSLALNLEANLVLRDADFAATLSASLERLLAEECKLAVTPPKPKWEWWRRVRNYALFQFLLRFPQWARRLPAHTPKLVVLAEGPAATAPTPAPAPAGAAALPDDDATLPLSPRASAERDANAERDAGDETGARIHAT